MLRCLSDYLLPDDDMCLLRARTLSESVVEEALPIIFPREVRVESLSTEVREAHPRVNYFRSVRILLATRRCLRPRQIFFLSVLATSRMRATWSAAPTAKAVATMGKET